MSPSTPERNPCWRDVDFSTMHLYEVKEFDRARVPSEQRARAVIRERGRRHHRLSSPRATAAATIAVGNQGTSSMW